MTRPTDPSTQAAEKIPLGGLVRYRTAAGPVTGVIHDDGEARIALVDGQHFSDLPALLEASRGDARRIVAGQAIDPSAELLAPLARPRKIICVGQNYLGHVQEGGRAAGPAYPDLFAKWDNALAGPYDVLPLPRESAQVDFEAELAVVVGRTCRRVRRRDAADVVFGFTAANDGSVRDFQFHTGQRTAGKAWDRLTPIGPAVVPAARLGGVRPDLVVSGALNGVTMQRDRTSNLLFDVPELIAYITTFLTLEPGDLILTGTPEGVGAVREPVVYLRDGDEFTVTIDGIGSLRNRYEREEP